MGLTFQPLSDARSFGHVEICKILEAQGGIDPVIQLINIYKILKIFTLVMLN